MSVGKADSEQRAPQEAPGDRVIIPEATRAVGVTPSAVHTWIKRGHLTVHASAGGLGQSGRCPRAVRSP